MSHPHDPEMNDRDTEMAKWIRTTFSVLVAAANHAGKTSCSVPVLAGRSPRDIVHFLFVAHSVTGYNIEEVNGEYNVSWNY